ncbi:MAG: hypothetical protein KatS3mg033_1438 [Thermonema sp.]|uniref:hypothetical protein n=1 Tax=Thermonema sp. TaxID=2231181 RepID=UPI0021DECF59|nr:hypothetical protein [Thermonema sp.]GIV39638.1 MAG: hypothetical protein KatS3mg033_1438 [Thermonema sp.]
MFIVHNRKRYVGYLLFSDLVSLSRYAAGIALIVHYFFTPVLYPHVFTGVLLATVLFRLLEIYIKPSFFQLHVEGNNISITDMPFRYNMLWMWVLMRRRLLTKNTIPLEEFNGFEISFQKGGWQRLLVIHRKRGFQLLKSMPYNISWLSIRDYTRLIMFLDELTFQQKVRQTPNIRHE